MGLHPGTKESTRRKTRIAHGSAAMAALALLCTDVVAQTSATLTGIVQDAADGAPLADVLVTLEPLPGGLILTRAGVLASARSVGTAADGAYRFDGVAPGRYRLSMQRIGYRSLTLDVDVRRPMDARISVGLELDPVTLEPVTIEGRAAPLFRRVDGGPLEEEAARLALERYRQDLFLTPDSRVITFADVIDGVTLGETDVFRALQRLPGVATRDDYTAELWTRGAPWAQTRVTFDGLPLFNPVHAVGIFSGVTPEILGAVFFHPGVRPPSLAEGAAGAVDLRSRPGDGEGAVGGELDLSMATAKLTLDQRLDDVAWVVSARRSYLDILTGGLDWLGLDDVDLPYAFHDLAARFDVPLGERAALEASGLWEEDRLYGSVEDVLEESAARWGNAAGRITLHAPAAAWAGHHTIGFSRYRAHIQPLDTFEVGRPPPWTEPSTDNRIAYMRLASEFETVSAPGAPADWSLGLDVVRQEARYDGPEPRYHPVKPDTTVRVTRDGALWNVGAWGEARLRAGRVEVSPGLRLETGASARNAAVIRPAPRIAVRFRLAETHTLSFAAGRSWQYLQALALAGPSAHPAFHAGQFWLLADDAAPAIRADVVTLGTERWFGPWLATATGFARHAIGVALPDPTPGALGRRPLYVEGENDAYGLELSIRRVAARWTASVGYTWGISNIGAAGLEFPAATDRRHRLDAMTAFRLGGGFRVGAAYTAMSGAPFTRVLSRSPEDCTLFGFGCGQTGAHIDVPNGVRTPAYASLDATLQWTRTLGRFEIGAYLQVRNLAGRDNASTYSGSSPVYHPRDGRFLETWNDRFEEGLPRMPLVGARIAF